MSSFVQSDVHGTERDRTGKPLSRTVDRLVAGGIAYLMLQSRARRRFEATGELTGNATGMATLGALVTVGAAFVPFSPVVGGAVAGYLRSSTTASAARTGALAGVLATVPVLAVYAAIT